MADINLQMGSYKLVALTVKSKTVDANVVMSSARQWLLYSDAPNFTMASFKPSVLIARTKTPDVAVAIAASRGWMIYADAPSFSVASWKVTALMARTNDPDIKAYLTAGRFVALFQPPFVSLQAGRFAFLIDQVVAGTPMYIPQVFSFAVQRNILPGVEQIYSTTRNLHASQMVVVQNTDNAFRWSITRVLQVARSALVALPVTPPQSRTAVAEAVSMALFASPLQTISRESVPQVAQLILISRDRAPIPTSGSFYAEMAVNTLLALPMSGMPQSPSKLASIARLAVQRRFDPFPRSIESVPQVVNLALVPNTLPLARSTLSAAESFMMALQASPMPGMNDPDYRRPADVAEAAELALFKQGDMPPWVGKEQTIQLAHATLQRAVMPEPYGVQHVTLAAELVLASNPLPKPGSMSGANLPSLRMQALLAASGYPLASGIQSSTKVVQAGLRWLVDSFYQKPGDIIAATKFSYYGSLHITTLMARHIGMSISTSRVPSVNILSVMQTHYDSPEQIFNDGLFITQIGEQVVVQEQYPTPWEPTSLIQATGIFEALLTTDDSFPDKSYSRSDIQATSITEALACEDNSFPDKDLPQSKVVADVIAESLAVTDDSFPNPNMPQAQLQATLTVESVASLADDYPAKDMVLSAVVVNSLVEAVAIRDQFPDKDVPQSIMEVSGVAEVVMCFDDTMTTLPQYQGRRKPTIFVQIVY